MAANEYVLMIPMYPPEINQNTFIRTVRRIQRIPYPQSANKVYREQRSKNFIQKLYPLKYFVAFVGSHRLHQWHSL